MRCGLNIVHPVELLRALPDKRAGDAGIPFLVWITGVAIAVTCQRLCQAVTVFVRHHLHHEAEDVVVDELLAVLRLRETCLDGRVGGLDDVAPCIDATAVGAEVGCRDGCFVFGVDVSYEDVWGAFVDQVLRVRSDAFRYFGREVGVLWVACPECVGVGAEVILACPDELEGAFDAGWRWIGVVQTDLVVDSRNWLSVPLRCCWCVGVVDCCSEGASSTAASECVVDEWDIEQARKVLHRYRAIGPCSKTIYIGWASSDSVGIGSVAIVAKLVAESDQAVEWVRRTR